MPPVHETEHDAGYLDGAGGGGQLGIRWADWDAFYQLPGEIQSRATDAYDPGGLAGQLPGELVNLILGLKDRTGHLRQLLAVAPAPVTLQALPCIPGLVRQPVGHFLLPRAVG